MAITRYPDINDSGDNQSGTSHSNEWKNLTIYDPIDGRWSGFRTALAGTQHDLVYSEADVIRCENATDLTLTGIAAPASPPKPYKPLRVVAAGLGHVFLTNQSANSSAAGRLHNYVTSSLTPLAAGKGFAEFIYDHQLLRWRLVKHEQGDWITPTFAAGNFTSASGTWTVAAGDVQVDRYYLRGRDLYHAFKYVTTDVSTTTAELRRAMPGGFTPVTTPLQPFRASDNGATAVIGLAQPSGTNIVYVSTVPGASWATASGTTSLEGSIRVLVV